MSISILNRGASGGMAASIRVRGLDEADTIFASNGNKIKEGALAYTRVPNPSYVELPAGYKQVDYIESTGEQCIITDFYPGTAHSITINFALPDAEDAGGHLCGVKFDTYKMYYLQAFPGGAVAAFYGGNATYNIISSADGLVKRGVLYELSSVVGGNSQKLYLDGVQVASGTCAASNVSASNRPMYLFGNNDRGSFTAGAKVRIGRAKMDTVHDLVSCINPDGVVGMYDLVKGTFRRNAGSGEFIAGPETPAWRPDYFYEINGITDLGVWTVTASDGEKTKTQDVLVEVIGLYEIEMDYRLWLYRRGDECEAVTGGWDTPTTKSSLAWDFKNTYGSITKTKTESSLHLVAKKTSSSQRGQAFASFWMNKAVNFEGHSKLCARVLNVIENDLYVIAYTSSPLATTVTPETTGMSVSAFSPDTGETEIIADITDLDGVYYCGAAMWWNSIGAATAEADLLEMWLE